ncbi:LysR family transcriptional regulator [Paraburkholderia aspalathi]|uniref:LysR family transcriptional regulator n=1 Tax=Paraburkholderia aspalathi TaxID=1324617 RepID=UPI001B2591B9|nr:LysR substrate-binding domain-containing protein [Paraburkholderia aspalathi]CAE6737745.1 HTH-type transcriptional regulator GltC [Paraburkholderia aspalathi]
MELRQLRYFVRVVNFGSMGRAAAELGVGTSALSQQISRLETELSTRLLQRTKAGVRPTSAGLAFFRQAQLAIRHADEAIEAAQHARLSGYVSIGMPPSVAGVLGLPFIRAMYKRYPDVHLRVVESLSGTLNSMLTSRQIDLAVLYDVTRTQQFSVTRLVTERLYVIGTEQSAILRSEAPLSLSDLTSTALILPSESHRLRALIDEAFSRLGRKPNVVAEIDGLAMLMEAVGDGLGLTIQPGAALARHTGGSFVAREILERDLVRSSHLASLSDDELSPAGLAARIILVETARHLTEHGKWTGATLIE